MYRKLLLFLMVMAGIFLLKPSQSFAASLNSLSDTVSTSRPSAASPLGADQAAGAGQVDIIDNNAVFLQGDSATAYADPAWEIRDNSLLVASMSATAIPSAGHRTVYLTNTVTDSHHKGDAFVVPITAIHTVAFKPVATIPVGGKIVISFPSLASVDNNPASASAQAFQFNNLQTANIQVNFSAGTSTCTLAITGTSASGSPTITCTVATAQVTGGSSVTVTFLIGCSAHSGASCTTQVPTLVNPMKAATNSLSGQGAATTQADNWKIGVLTQDASSVTLDSGTAVVGTIESVQVQANIDPTLTFQIAGIANAVNVSSGHGTGCPSQSTNTGIGSNATFVNLGTVGTNINIAAQDLTVSTNGQGGYSLTATASGQLNDAQNNYNITSSTTPGFVTAGTELFGVHPCGTDVNTGTWGTGTIGGGANAKVAWPTTTTAITLASRASTANAIVTTAMYAITASATTPAGLYTAVITYVATPTFN